MVTLAALKTSTNKEVEALLAAGGEQLTPEELFNRAKALGYVQDKVGSFCYVNDFTSNPRPYRARSIAWKDKETGLSFAHVNARRDDRFKAFQSLRYFCFVFHNGRVWEL